MKYVLKKTASMLITLLVVSFLVFAAFALIPGDPATRLAGMEGTPEQIEAIRARLGLDAPLVVRYGRWIAGLLRGDLGSSYIYPDSVWSLLKGTVPVTAALALIAFFFTMLIAFPLGVYTAKYENTIPDRIVTVLNQVIMAVPPFLTGVVFSALFGMVLKWFTPGAYVPFSRSASGFFAYLLLPAFCIALPKACMATKMLRASMLEESVSDYARTAYSRGNTVDGVMYRHLLKNASLPVVTFLGMALTDMLVGSIVVEKIFDIPGLSSILINSISNRDYPVVQAAILLIAIIIMVVNLATDLLYRLLDPRIET
ncbi:MAG: ABC transporter permease [Lachnospiraceae bacterium]|nr:ABC transporter permease [Lachnospiraceae bacterium]